jgi:hypothetical protein
MENSRAVKTILVTMGAVLVLSLCAQGFLSTQKAYAWDNVSTHPVINEFAFNNFVGQWMPYDPYLKNANLQGGLATGLAWDPTDGTSWFSATAKTPVKRQKNIQEWLISGGFSADEPEFPMSLVHFYDPVRMPHYLTDTINDLPAGVGTWNNPNTDAYQWAFESTDNVFSFANGETYFQSALASRDSSDINYGKAWRSVGETMHLISDMTVPAHVRNDAHIPWGNLYDPMEYFADSGDVQAYGTGYPATSDFGSYNTAYTTDKDIRTLFKEVATWTNQSFFSRDTVPQYNSNTTPNGKLAYPSPKVTINPTATEYYTTNFDGNKNFPLARAAITGLIWKTPYLVVDQTVFDAQRKVLIPTAIKASAAVMDAFLPRFQVIIDKVEPDTKIKGNYVISAHIKQIPTREWPHDLIIRNGAHIVVNGVDTVVTTDTNLDNKDTLNTIKISLPAKEGNSVSANYVLGGYEVYSDNYKISASSTVPVATPSSKPAPTTKPTAAPAVGVVLESASTLSVMPSMNGGSIITLYTNTRMVNPGKPAEFSFTVNGKPGTFTGAQLREYEFGVHGIELSTDMDIPYGAANVTVSYSGNDAVAEDGSRLASFSNHLVITK